MSCLGGAVSCRPVADTVLHRLKEEAILTMKGVMAEVAAQLGVSVPTAYRYLSK